MNEIEYRSVIAFLVMCIGFFIVREFTLKDKALSKMEEMGKLLIQFQVIAADTKTVISEMRLWATDRFAARDTSEVSIQRLWDADATTRQEFYRDVKKLREEMETQMRELKTYMTKPEPPTG